MEWGKDPGIQWGIISDLVVLDLLILLSVSLLWQLLLGLVFGLVLLVLLCVTLSHISTFFGYWVNFFAILVFSYQLHPALSC